ncbi:RsbT co-antagonist protein RsbRA [Oceanobacillus sp. FSL H7-0719]|uniref:RsbT co-antagonist protein RsbRA n=1 Tax=Oceanobacillus sp. FSL H7-0719 TaxID=2954507 RepID=UPI00324B0F18
MNTRFKRIVVDNSDKIVQMWMEKLVELKEKNGTIKIADELYENTNREFVNVIFKSIQNQGSTDEVEAFSEKVVKLGWPLSYITDGLQIFRRVTVDYILNTSDELIDTNYISNVLSSVDDWVEPIISQLVNEYSGSWEQIVSLQRIALQELSAPLIPVMDGITIMPLIGTIDTERAKLIMENLLQGTINHNSEVVLIDITGVPVVDTMVAHHIIQAAEAVHLIGAKCILVGIRPEIAQTIVNLGIDLSDFSTKSSLRKGFTSALEITDRKIVPLEGKDREEQIRSIIDSVRGE